MRPVPFPRRNCRGFTLTEILVVIAVVIILTGAAYSGYSSWQRREQARAAAYELAGHLKEARFLAMEKNTGHTAVFVGNTYTVFSDPNNSMTLDAGERVLHQVNVAQKNPGVTVSTSAGLSVHYNARGTISLRDSVNPNLLGATIAFSNAANTYTVTLSSLGRIKIEP
ncbi:MAG TPA: GspH/FimT family pseudopilin [Syntrophobacteraceae bacterium]|nr:GspH/FimT family pseudopilin [Syntrophobacteraceae bacterium]